MQNERRGKRNAMSKKDKKASGGERGDLSQDSVYDFLYCDTRRIGSFLAQFDVGGHLQQVTSSESASKGYKRGYKVGLGGGATLAGTGGNGEVNFERGPAEIGSEELQRVYDPLWSNALSLLDFLEERHLIQRDIAEASIGNFVLSSGSLSISDLQLMHRTWQLPSVKKLMRSGVTPTGQNRQQRRAGAGQPAPDFLELFTDLVSILPHTIQASLTGDAEIWCSLHQQGMTTDASDITLKHGTVIPGEWSVLGILDARPGAMAPSDDLDFSDGEEMAIKMMTVIAPLAKNLLGRPPRCYGVTPLLLFREISGATD